MAKSFNELLGPTIWSLCFWVQLEAVDEILMKKLAVLPQTA